MSEDQDGRHPALRRADEEDPSQPRRRGRPRKTSGGDDVSTRARIVRAAADEFAERGYEAASLRAIARRAGVDAALVHHYFDDKADLFAETVAAPIRPDRAIAALLAGPADEFGTGIVRYVLRRADDPSIRTRIVAMLRTAVGSSPAGGILRQFLIREVLLRLAASIESEDAELRASLAASQIIGMLMGRLVLGIEPLASAPIEQIVARVGPVVQWHLRGYGETSEPGAAGVR